MAAQSKVTVIYRVEVTILRRTDNSVIGKSLLPTCYKTKAGAQRAMNRFILLHSFHHSEKASGKVISHTATTPLH